MRHDDDPFPDQFGAEREQRSDAFWSAMRMVLGAAVLVIPIAAFLAAFGGSLSWWVVGAVALVCTAVGGAMSMAKWMI